MMQRVEKKQNKYAELETMVASAIKGDKQALNDICVAITRDVLYMAKCFLPNNEDAEDLSQEVLYEICKNITKLREPKVFRKWMSSIVINKKNDFLTERTKRGEVVDLSEYLENLEEEREEFIPAASLENNELRKVILDLIYKLPERQQEAIMLRYFDGFSVTEISNIMEIGHPNVSQYLVLAGKKIKLGLEKYMRSTGDKGNDIRSHAVMPIGAALTEVLRQESVLFGMANEAIIQNIALKCAEYIATGAVEAATAATAATAAEVAITSTVATTAVASTAAATSAATSPTVIAGICGVIMASAIGVGAFMSGLFEIPPPQSPRTATVEFLGGISHGEDVVHLNPEDISVDYQDMQALYWWVTAAGSEEVILEGQGGIAEGITGNLIDSGITSGEFMVYFRLESQRHQRHTVSKNFYVMASMAGNTE